MLFFYESALGAKGLRPIYSDATQLDVELSCVAINGRLENDRDRS